MARCPKCGNIGQVPGATPEGTGAVTPPPAAPPPPRPAYGGTGPETGPASNPFAAGVPLQRGQPQPATPGEVNPYASSATVREYPQRPVGPGGYPTPTRAALHSKVSGPGTALIVLGSLNMVFFGIFALVGAFALMDEAKPEDWIPLVVLGAIMLVKGSLMIYGGLQMTRMKNYGMAMTGAIIALVPCFYCWMAELGFGIWAIVVLSDYHVRMAFQNKIRPNTGTDNPFGSRND